MGFAVRAEEFTSLPPLRQENLRSGWKEALYNTILRRCMRQVWLKTPAEIIYRVTSIGI
jgi:hypothetical protein